ncbi:group II intron reverse transcriptase/maturase [Sedimentibacter sp. MB31-C6]|uniref:group II intron reverse transcriptase/maturase n=1 Tax=Sedimentibacter sp. MB31-C6 TaxID=3109366 RepID=UPI002DDD95CE|nr:group II intron reverse transcriptase/maturase [Sedimentibacter sp. MB36-C1]WSI04599.1 group II intron reverse transcriptase/maturase [Sedimentibacter sp. MB36-C1]
MKGSKPYEISKLVVLEAFKSVKRNKGSAGIDEVDIEDFQKDLKGNLYKIWNRMSSGSYFPPPVKAVEIPKKSGGTRRLGIPTISDRIAQMVVKMYLGSKIEAVFHEDSYGYRPNKSALDAIGQARQRCWKYDYVIEFDIKGLFDNIDHKLLMKAVKLHTKEPWILLYIERWLKAPFIVGKEMIERTSGTPQGGVISPILANLFMHYAFDVWLTRNYKDAPFERYADDAIIHCRNEKVAQEILSALNIRLNECKLELHPLKTKIVYCKDKDRKLEYLNTEFDFLGYTFRRIFIKDRTGRLHFNFLPQVSRKSAKSFRDKIKEKNIHSMSGSKIEKVAEILNPMIRGWLNYFSKYNKSAVKYTMDCINRRLVKWAMSKYKHFRNHRSNADKWLKEIAKREPNMFAHWAFGFTP